MLLLSCHFCGAPLKAPAYQFDIAEAAPMVLAAAKNRVMLKRIPGGLTVSADLCSGCGGNILAAVAEIRKTLGSGAVS